MPKTTATRSRRPSLFRGKLRKPVTIALTPRHHRKVEEAMAKLDLSRSDVIALLIDAMWSDKH